MRFHFKHILINEKCIDYYCYGKQNPHQKKKSYEEFLTFYFERKKVVGIAASAAYKYCTYINNSKKYFI